MEIDFPIPTQNRYPRLRLDQMESPPSSPSSLASSSTVKASSSPPPSPSEDEEGSDSDDSLDPLGTLESDNIESIPCSQNPARRYYVPRKRSRRESSPTPLHYCSRTGKGKREDELLSTQGPPRKRKRGRKASGEGGDGGVLEAEAASRKPSDWDGEKWWRMTYSEDEEFDKKEQELEELAKEEKERGEKEWVAKREREREKGEKEKPNGGKEEKRDEEEEGKEKLELEGEDTELEGGVIIELEGEEIVELEAEDIVELEEEENGENVNGVENPDNLKGLDSPKDANFRDEPAGPHHSRHPCASR